MTATPAAIARLHRAAQAIENSARSQARQPSPLMGLRPFSWPFNGHDLLRELERAGLTVTEAKGTTP